VLCVGSGGGEIAYHARAKHTGSGEKAIRPGNLLNEIKFARAIFAPSIKQAITNQSICSIPSATSGVFLLLALLFPAPVFFLLI
jgi:hypothetical protein